ncbi:uncharacterized protein [Ptychodera flava]|uniref:uncharacterized protein n=1 Tax=Ptychodera flava TaxID=63121 RepID=UPI003969D721
MSEVVASGSGYTGERESRKRKHNSGDGGDSDDESNKKGHDKHGEVGVQQKVQRMATDEIQPAALLVIDRWGSPINGGIAAALYLIIGLLKTWRLEIYCTVLEADDKTVRKAALLGVNLIFPEKIRGYEKLRPHYLWLVGHKTYFPHLNKIKSLKVVFGFGLLSASVALNIKEDVLSSAKYFHVNVWCPEGLPDNMFPYDKEFTEANYEWLDHQNLYADAVLSVGVKTFEYFDDRFGSRLTEHTMLLPLPEIVHFEVPTSDKIPRTRNFQILTPIENCYASYMTHNDILPYSMNLVAESYDNFGKEEPPKWKIMCMKKYDDKTVSELLKPHAKLRILSHGFTKENFSSEIDFSHLIILPPLSINSLNVTLTTIARGKPIIVPLASESDYFIEKYFSDFRHNMVVDMRGKSDELKEKIVDVIKNYATHLNYASRVREIMKNEVMKEVQSMNSELFNCIQRYIQLPEESTGHLSRKGSLTVQIEPSYGSAVEGSSMADVTERFHEVEGSRPATEGTGKVLSDTHKDIDVEKVEQGCLRYVTNCGSLEALEALWSEYISGRLDKTIHSTIITPTLLSKIQAHYLTLDIYIPVQEYLLCKRENIAIVQYVIFDHIVRNRNLISSLLEVITNYQILNNKR